MSNRCRRRRQVERLKEEEEEVKSATVVGLFVVVSFVSIDWSAAAAASKVTNDWQQFNQFGRVNFACLPLAAEPSRAEKEETSGRPASKEPIRG